MKILYMMIVSLMLTNLQATPTDSNEPKRPRSKVVSEKTKADQTPDDPENLIIAKSDQTQWEGPQNGGVNAVNKNWGFLKTAECLFVRAKSMLNDPEEVKKGFPNLNVASVIRLMERYSPKKCNDVNKDYESILGQKTKYEVPKYYLGYWWIEEISYGDSKILRIDFNRVSETISNTDYAGQKSFLTYLNYWSLDQDFTLENPTKDSDGLTQAYYTLYQGSEGTVSHFIKFLVKRERMQ